jgi:PAS domain S-box-containing protein
MRGARDGWLGDHIRASRVEQRISASALAKSNRPARAHAVRPGREPIAQERDLPLAPLIHVRLNPVMNGEHDGKVLESRARAVDGGTLLDLLIEQVVDYAIFVLDRDGRIASWNAGAQRIKGYSAQEIIGKPYAIFFTDEDRRAGKPREILSQARREGRFQEEGWRVRKDGRRFWASVVVTALRDAHGEHVGFAKITRDLTEQRRADEAARHAAEERAARQQAELDERQVRRSRDELDLILRNIAEGVTAQRPDGALVYANEAAAQLTGFESSLEMLAVPREEILDRFEMVREDGTPFPPDELPGRLALKGTPATALVRFRSKRTGEERLSIVSGAPVFDGAGNVELAVSVFRDVTERRRSEEAWQFLAGVGEALASSRDITATLTQVTDLAVPRVADWCTVELLDPHDRLEQLAIAHVDPAKRELAKQWRQRWPPRPDSAPYRVVRSGTPQLAREITDEMLEAGTEDAEERRVLRALGLRSAMVVPLVVGQKPFGVISFAAAESGRRYGSQELILATEIARRAALAVENARAFTEARTAIQTRDNFLAIASHELRTPLSGLTMLLTSLVRMADGRLAQLGPEALKDRLVKAERQAGQLARLVDRLLDVSRLSTRDIHLERERADLGEIARDVLSRFEDAIAESGSSVELKVQGPTVGVWDRSRIDQVVTNLVGNALKYGAGAPVTVSIGSGWTGQVRLTVRDEGPGIAPENHERIFSQYERAASDAYVGMGLGLWLVRRIVTAHGGTVTVDSVPGKGATFTVILPLNLEAAS